MDSQIVTVTPEAQELWVGIGGHFETLQQILCEFLDNSFSNLRAIRSGTVVSDFTQSSISLFITPPGHANIKAATARDGISYPLDHYLIEIQDNGTGFMNIEAALTIGNKALRTTAMNEYGFGLKHALAAANPSNNAWTIYTKNSEKILKIQAPYAFEMPVTQLSSNECPILDIHGTRIVFSCSEHLFKTLTIGHNAAASQLPTLTRYLVEDIGYIYSYLLLETGIPVSVYSYTTPITPENFIVTPVLPPFLTHHVREGVVDSEIVLRPTTELPQGGNLPVRYAFGLLSKPSSVLSGRYYRRNMATAGIELRINGRLVADNLLTEIWPNVERHPDFNYFRGVVNLISDDRTLLPHAKTAKNGLRITDERYYAILNWIRMTLPSPLRADYRHRDEQSLVEKLSAMLLSFCKSPAKLLQREFKVFVGQDVENPASCDIYFFDGQDVTLMECKAKQSCIKDIYQLLMYWDGYVFDLTSSGTLGGASSPTSAELIATEHPEHLQTIVEHINMHQDANGGNYNIVLKTWSDYQIYI